MSACELTSRSGPKRDVALVGCGAILRLFVSGKEQSGLFAREACVMPLIKEKTLARILNELAIDCDLCDFAEKCEQLLDSALSTGSALVVCAALHRRPPGFDRLAPACSYITLLDFRLAGKDAFFLLLDIARNLVASDSVNLSKPYKIDRALFISSRLEQASHLLDNPRERLAAAALADAFRLSCTKADPTFSALDSSALRGPEVDWVKAHAAVVEFENLHIFVEQLQSALWPSSAYYATQLTPALPAPPVSQSYTQAEDVDMFVAL
jgi:hypothetical protein